VNDVQQKQNQQSNTSLAAAARHTLLLHCCSRAISLSRKLSFSPRQPGAVYCAARSTHLSTKLGGACDENDTAVGSRGGGGHCCKVHRIAATLRGRLVVTRRRPMLAKPCSNTSREAAFFLLPITQEER